ncbi:MAG: hypothetical protein K2X87_21475 [Gemmataceae bacterium]|nr:hypothetical protein [Gemmataceae bacterium]
MAYRGLGAGADFPFRWEGYGTHTRHVGVLNWLVPDTEAGTAGLGREFRSFCGEALVGVEAGRTYRFEVQPADGPAGFGLPDTDEGKAAAARRTTYLRELFGRRYDPDAWATDPDAARAFQAAVWEITHEAEPADGSAARLDLFDGAFRADYPAPTDAPAFVRTAQEYLGGLTGDDAPFRQNGATVGRQLVRLGGLPSPAAGGAAAQSQFGLASAGSAGGGGAAGSTGPGGFGGAAPFGGGLGGLGGGFGGLGGLGGGFGGGGFGGSGSVPTGPFASSPAVPPPSLFTPTGGPPETLPPFTALPPEVIPPPLGGPTDTLPPFAGLPPVTPEVLPPPFGGPTETPTGTPTEVPPAGGPSGPPGVAPTPTAPVPIPAPAGLVLGLIGAGVVLARRAAGRAKR